MNIFWPPSPYLHAFISKVLVLLSQKNLTPLIPWCHLWTTPKYFFPKNSRIWTRFFCLFAPCVNSLGREKVNNKYLTQKWTANTYCSNIFCKWHYFLVHKLSRFFPNYFFLFCKKLLFLQNNLDSSMLFYYSIRSDYAQLCCLLTFQKIWTWIFEKQFKKSIKLLFLFVAKK